MSPTENLPELTDESIDRMESGVFARIAEDRTRDVSRARSRRGRAWLGAGAAAAVVVVAAAVLAPTVGGLVSPMEAGSSADQSAVAPDAGSGIVAPDAARLEAADESSSSDSSAGAATDQADAAREIIASASATVLVDDVAAGADEVSALAARYDGYVESMNVGTVGGAEPMVGDMSTIYPPQPPSSNYGWVSIRVPADDLQAAIDDLDDVGEVTAVSVNRTDVTDQAIDLRARVDATRASVDRLTQLMSQSASVDDLIAAEVALSDRQALLEGYEQQLAQLESQVAMSSLQVNLTSETPPVKADPAGFGDGLVTGWNALVATLNGIVIALGFLLPWIVVVGVAALLLWGIVRLVRRRRAARRSTPTQDAGGERASL
ncbi:DUF4349 domain-containing protein [Micromonospora sp. DT81.3]|uniref:DUF4349 domain-containing protein n=1 Tax=Micromonospora sp. DT81.3 TaxID=3416523 RepID=UPI003CE6B5AE